MVPTSYDLLSIVNIPVLVWYCNLIIENDVTIRVKPFPIPLSVSCESCYTKR
jgi:hypothetical protein